MNFDDKERPRKFEYIAFTVCTTLSRAELSILSTYPWRCRQKQAAITTHAQLVYVISRTDAIARRWDYIQILNKNGSGVQINLKKGRTKY